METFIINFSVLVFLYLIIFLVYFAACVIISTRKKKIGLKDKYVADDLQSNLTVVLYVSENTLNLSQITGMLENQNYSKENLKIAIVADNVPDEKLQYPEDKHFISVHRINNGIVMGKDAAISWLLGKLVSFGNINAFIFLDTNSVIAPDFLSQINRMLFSYDVIFGTTELEPTSIYAKYKNSVTRFNNRIFNITNTILNLPSPINTKCCAIKQEILEHLKKVNFTDTEGEFEFSAYLTKSGFSPIFVPGLVAQSTPKKDLTVLQKIKLFKKLGKSIFSSGYKYAALMLSMLRPSGIVVTLLFAGLFLFIYNYDINNFLLRDEKLTTIAAALYLIVFAAACAVARDEKINYFLFILYPFIRPFEKFKKHFKNGHAEAETKQTLNEYPVSVYDGDKNFKCTLTFQNREDGVTATFGYKNKSISGSTYSNALGAIAELDGKLWENGLKLKICATCAHFALKSDSRTNPMCGQCFEESRTTDGVHPTTHITDGCERYKSPCEIPNSSKNGEQI